MKERKRGKIIRRLFEAHPQNDLINEMKLIHPSKLIFQLDPWFGNVFVQDEKRRRE